MHPSPPPLAIRPLVESVLALYTHLHPADDALPPLPQVQAIWQGLMADPRNLYLGGFVGPELVSSCVLLVIANLTRGCRPYALIENVVTHADYRQRGYGRALLHAALAQAWAKSCHKAMLMTGSKDEATLRFYAEAGFDSHEKQAFVARPPA
ncbi:GNAT superfamily N-acetyltransferase [Comamonas sp. BIGb0152]|uniref:GNAT family N-acetyltransferase n=1 Tax=Comamonas sp. BIGb0152 TaxID=2940601 RepID=UPI00216961C6|nr:GNAT family N-acetyltransferase [Comamonas sp. BIGb0152]MCS4294982.1 GNAT superfamily N-acetyltransferase [Comamonas sp. BIGb0152]